MRRKKAEFARVYENCSLYTKYVIGYKVINIPRFKRKKKPISMIKALEVRDRINNKINTDKDNKIDFVNDELLLNGQRVKGVKTANINISGDWTVPTTVDLQLYANNHKRKVRKLI